MAMALPAHIPSPSINSFSIGPLVIHFYALAYLVGIALAIIITRRRWRAVGGDPDIVGDVALWSVPAGIIGGRIYFDITTPMDIPHVWYGVFAVWDGGLGIWGGIALATVVGLWRLRRHGVNTAQFMDAVAPALLVAQGIGRIGNYFNKELFGRPTSLPWGLDIPFQYRVSGGIPAKYLNAATFQPTFLYELIFDFAWAAVLVWLGHHRKIKAPGLFALYVFGYSAYRIFEESLRIDSSVYFLGLRLNTYIASALALAGLFWFWRSQRRPAPAESAAPDSAASLAPAAAVASLDSAAPDSAAAAAGLHPADVAAERAAPASAPAERAPAERAAPASTVNPADHTDHSELENSGSGISHSENSESESSGSGKSGSEQAASSSQAASET
jgi:prolipoprotein diacylglyceryl transferase